MRYNSSYNADKHAEKYIILDWAGNVKTFNKKSIKLFDDVIIADNYLDEQIIKNSKSKYEKSIIKDDYNNNFEKYFEETKGEYYIDKCKNIFTNYVCDPFGFANAINI